MSAATLSIGALARATGLTPHTLRYYEAEGLLRPAARRASGHRAYAPGDVDWLAFVLRLKATGMPLAEIRTYAALRAEGDATLAERLALLQRHRERLHAQQRELARHAAALDDKIARYAHGLTAAPSPATGAPHEPAPADPIR